MAYLSCLWCEMAFVLYNLKFLLRVWNSRATERICERGAPVRVFAVHNKDMKIQTQASVSDWPKLVWPLRSRLQKILSLSSKTANCLVPWACLFFRQWHFLYGRPNNVHNQPVKTLWRNSTARSQTLWCSGCLAWRGLDVKLWDFSGEQRNSSQQIMCRMSLWRKANTWESEQPCGWCIRGGEGGALQGLCQPSATLQASLYLMMT